MYMDSKHHGQKGHKKISDVEDYIVTCFINTFQQFYWNPAQKKQKENNCILFM